MASSVTIGYFVGSLSRDSINRKLARALVKVAPPNTVLREIPYADLPLYNRDLDGNQPESVRTMKDAILAVDAVLFVTPEYNRSIPGALKNAIDWASRPYGKNSFTKKPSAVIGASVGKIGTAVAQQHLRSILAHFNAPQVSAVEAYVHFTPDLIDDEGRVKEKSTEDFLRKFMSEFGTFIGRFVEAGTGDDTSAD